jgi:thiosulfate/3-mercaptopyruvate sulfurtransferase
MRSRLLAAALFVSLDTLATAPAIRGQDACGEREPPPGPLVSADWLKRHRADSGLVILHPDRTRAGFEAGHIPGARFVPTAQYMARQGDRLTELPPVAQLDSLFESLGVGDRGRIVIYGEILPATRLFFTLDYLGLGDRVSVLNGGLESWTRAGGVTTAEAGPAPAPASLTVRPQSELLADAAYVNARRTSPAVLLLDARTQQEFDGTVQEEGVTRPGHIPGAVRLDWTELISEGKFRDKGELRPLFAAAGAAPGREIITYCRVGSRASALYFAARLLGYPVRLYDGSMNDWASRAELPVERKP